MSAPTLKEIHRLMKLRSHKKLYSLGYYAISYYSYSKALILQGSRVDVSAFGPPTKTHKYDKGEYYTWNYKDLEVTRYA